FLVSTLYVLSFFFSSRRRHTRFSRDWSSDVCSSDLVGLPQPRARPALRKATMTDIQELLLSRIRDVPDHPEPGVMFKDITPLLADPAAFTALTDALAGIAAATGATKIVGLEARGFILGAPVAVRAGLGFI